MKDTIVRIANPGDVPAITACVCEAYVHYIERIGKRPGPMLEDFQETVGTAQVHVVESNGRVVGVAVILVTDEGFYLDNVAVPPSVRGTRVGRPARVNPLGPENVLIIAPGVLTGTPAPSSGTSCRPGSGSKPATS